MKLIPDLREFIGLLNSENVQYLVIRSISFSLIERITSQSKSWRSQVLMAEIQLVN
jgi:hypothetical protein